MADVSLGEILSVARDPGEGAISPRAKIDTQQLAQTVNQAAQFKAENDWRKYSSFMENLKGVYKELGDLEGLEVATQDRPVLQSKAAEIFKKIGDNPQAFFSGKMGDIEKEIGSLRSLSAQSMQDKIFDDAHRSYVERDPTLQTDENKKLIGNYFNQPLGQRKPYMLNLPSLYNPQEIGNQINVVAARKFSNSGLTPDGKFINTVTGTRVDEKTYKALADQMYNSPDSKTGRLISSEVAGRFKDLPPALQNMYKEKYPDDPIKGYYDDTVSPWRKPDQIEKNEIKADPFAVEKIKSQDKLQQMNVKFGYDKILEGMKIGGQKSIAVFKEQLRNKSKKEQVGAVSGLVDKMLSDAYTGTPEVGQDLDEPYYTIPASPKELGIYSIKMGLQGTKTPDKIILSESGDKVRAIFYNSPGVPESGINEKMSKTFSKNEFKIRAIKDLVGQTATEKELNADEDEDTTDESSSTTTTTQEVSKPKLY